MFQILIKKKNYSADVGSCEAIIQSRVKQSDNMRSIGVTKEISKECKFIAEKMYVDVFDVMIQAIKDYRPDLIDEVRTVIAIATKKLKEPENIEKLMALEREEAKIIHKKNRKF